MRSTLDEETSGDFERVSEGKGAKHIKKTTYLLSELAAQNDGY